ncbi:ATP-binding cassette domain-containing protein [Actinoplanes cyaneus]|uniref:ATP-binding cassette domain-containing protein n=1 Tax=Actinoplanes cyaneus TaxID=52696 RepID=UPI001EF18405|nr:ATP-binding cassette domain-containing protein [Actinoplanes cyaneus]
MLLTGTTDTTGIRALSLTKNYGRRTAVKELSFTAAPGVVTGFLGPNGAGKTTTMRMLLGLTRPSSGTITIGGRPLARLDNPAREVGALLDARATHPQRTAFHHLLAFAQTMGLGRGRVDEVLGLVGLSQVAGRRTGEFSLGMNQRLGIATALLGDPEVLVLDEPLNGLDPEGIRWARTFLRDLAREGRTVLFSSHLMSEMELTADDLVVVGQGRLIAESSLDEFVRANTVQAVTVRAAAPDELARALTRAGTGVSVQPDAALLVTGTDTATVGRIAAAQGIALIELAPVRESLEDVFLRLTDDATEYEGQPA